MREFRLLLPWFDEQTAVRLQLGTAEPMPDTVRAAAQRWQRAVEKRRARRIDRFDAATFPLPAELAAQATAFAAAAKLAGQPEFRGAELRMVALSSLLTFQSKISTGARARFLEAYDGSPEALFRLCLPVDERSEPVQVRLQGATATISSANPNLRFGGFQLVGASLNATFGFRPPWVQVAEYMGRLFVRNGYHRCWALLSAGAEHAVAVVVPVRTIEDLGAAQPGYIGEEHLLGSAPALLSDFEDPDLYAVGTEAVPRRTITITATEAVEVSRP